MVWGDSLFFVFSSFGSVGVQLAFCFGFHFYGIENGGGFCFVALDFCGALTYNGNLRLKVVSHINMKLHGQGRLGELRRRIECG